MNKLLLKITERQMVKASLDNLPSGICFFNENGIPVLCNRQMHKLSFALFGHDLQDMENLEKNLATLPKESKAIKDGVSFILPDKTAHRFEKNKIFIGKKQYFQFIAFDVTLFYNRKQKLEESNCKQREIMKKIDDISQNIAMITRNEEALKMKMKMHNELGVVLNSSYRFIADGCPEGDKQNFALQHIEMAKILLGETQSKEDINPFDTLYEVATQMGMSIELDGNELLSDDERTLLSYAVRECLTNAIRHANGDKVFVKITSERGRTVTRITNNGNPPTEPIAEGGGLSSLREKLQGELAQMTIKSLPEFEMTIYFAKRSSSYD